MTLKIKTVREQPLLTPPRETEWRQFTPADGKILMADLAEGRKSRDANNIAVSHYYLMRLGKPQTVTESDVQVVRFRLEDCRKKHLTDTTIADPGLPIAKLHHYMKELGQKLEVTRLDEHWMREELKEQREGRWGIGIARMLYWMRELGFDEEVTAEDDESMKAHLEDFRSREHTDGVLQIQYFRKKLSLPADVTAEDEKLMLKQLTDLRTGKNKEYNVGRVLCMMREIMPDKEAGKQTPQQPPPLKKFQR